MRWGGVVVIDPLPYHPLPVSPDGQLVERANPQESRAPALMPAAQRLDTVGHEPLEH
jgi:hypothetical protein